MKKTTENLIIESLESVGAGETKYTVEHPDNLAFGDYSTNAGIVSKKALELLKYIDENKPEEIQKVEIKSGFINFYLSKEFFKKSIGEIIEKNEGFGKNKNLKGQKIIVEYTDPNPFKQFHIGHVMSNTIGEAITKILEANGASIKRVCYQGDVGMHVAKTLWGLPNDEPGPSELANMIRMAGLAYAKGSQAFDQNPKAAEEIRELNRKIYTKDPSIMGKYTKWRKASLDYFNVIYKILGTKFDNLFFESESGPIGKEIVESNIPVIFERSDNAVVYHGEKDNPALHTRVFISSEGNETYEAKELGLFVLKNIWTRSKNFPVTKSIVITGNEVDEYFKVVMSAAKKIDEIKNLAERTTHISHGMLRLPTGKMSSRTGDVTPFFTEDRPSDNIPFLGGTDSLLQRVGEPLYKKFYPRPDIEINLATDDDLTKLGKEFAQLQPIEIGSIKYMILRQSIGNDIIFDIEKSVSTEGDSGVYLQYAYARTTSLLEKASVQGKALDGTGSARPHDNSGAGGDNRDTHEVEKLLYRFPEIVERAGEEYSPNIIVTYLTELAGSFNNFYAHEQIISDEPESAYRVAIVKAFRTVMKNGLNVLGIPAPEKM